MNDNIGIGDLVRVKRSGRVGVVRRDCFNGLVGVSFDGTFYGSLYYRDEIERVFRSEGDIPRVWQCTECNWWNFGHEESCRGCQALAAYSKKEA